MSSPELDNLVRIGKLKREASSDDEISGLLRSAEERLNDAGRTDLSYSSRFDLAYNDRRILDQQIRDTIKQFAQVCATVGHAEHSGDLRKLIAEGKKIIISTVQKFPALDDGHRLRVDLRSACSWTVTTDSAFPLTPQA